MLITKNITEPFIDAVCAHKDDLIIHATVTGYGGTVLEPNVPSWETAFQNVVKLLNAGFPREKLVIRIDPIIPTPKGIATADKVFRKFMEYALPRYRISLIDMYQHVQQRFRDHRLPSPYNGDNFEPSKEQLAAVDTMVSTLKVYWDYLWAGNPMYPLRIESCAEKGLKETNRCGCVSAYDLQLLGLDTGDVDTPPKKRQRPACMCYAGKTELLSCKAQCNHKCLYCYWQ